MYAVEEGGQFYFWCQEFKEKYCYVLTKSY